MKNDLSKSIYLSWREGRIRVNNSIANVIKVSF
jgi:hypothetical protein